MTHEKGYYFLDGIVSQSLEKSKHTITNKKTGKSFVLQGSTPVIIECERYGDIEVKTSPQVFACGSFEVKS